jgi:hypothetical protein
MQSNAKWFIKLLGQKIKDTLAFNHRVVAQSSSSSYSSKALDSRTTFTLIASIIGHKHTQSKQTSILRTKHQSKECTKGQAQLDGSLKNTKCAWKGKAWLTLKRWWQKIEQGLERSHWDRARSYWLRKRRKRWKQN